MSDAKSANDKISSALSGLRLEDDLTSIRSFLHDANSWTRILQRTSGEMLTNSQIPVYERKVIDDMDKSVQKINSLVETLLRMKGLILEAKVSMKS